MPSLPIKNPYSHLLGMMRGVGSMDNPDGIFPAKVVSVSPLIIESGDLQVDSANILVADFLLPDHQVSYEEGGTSHTATLKNVLQVGDYVAVIPSADKQTYFVLCKVVTPNG